MCLSKHLQGPENISDSRGLTPIAIKYFERLVLQHKKTSSQTLQIHCSSPTVTIDQWRMQFYTRFTPLSHLDNKNCYVRLLFVDYSSAFYTFIPTKLIYKLLDLGLSATLCNWILHFLTNRPQCVRTGSKISSPLTLSTGTLQGSVFQPGAVFLVYT